MPRPTSGARVYLQVSGLQVACVVVATKNAYGHERVEVEPVAGIGRTWVDAAKVVPIAEAEGQNAFGFIRDAQRGELEDLWGVRNA